MERLALPTTNHQSLFVSSFLLTTYYHHHHHHHHSSLLSSSSLATKILFIIIQIIITHYLKVGHAMERGEIAEVKMLFEANRSLFLNSASPHYAARVWIPLTSSSSLLLSLSSLSLSSFSWFHFIHLFAIWW